MQSANSMTLNDMDQLRVRPWMAWVVCVSAALFFFYEFIQMHMFSAISQELMQTYQINAKQLGQLSSVYFYANVLFLFPAGLILDRFSTKKIILYSLSICVLGTLAFAMTTQYNWAYFFRFLTGIGSAFCFLSCIRLATRWFPSQRMALVTGVVVTMAMLGGMMAQTPLTLLVGSVGWRYALIMDGMLGVAILLLIARSVKDYPPHHKETPSDVVKKSLNVQDFFGGMRKAYGRSQNWLCALYTCTMNMPLGVLGAIWGIPYLINVHGLEKTQASTVTMMLYIGTLIGGPLAGWWSDSIRRRRLPMLVGVVLSMIVTFVVMSSTHLAYLPLLTLFFLLGFVTSTQVISYPTVAEGNSLIFTATAVSVVSITTQGGLALFHPLFGSLLESSKGGVINGLSVYSMADYQYAFWMIPVGLLVAFITALLIKETQCKQSD